ncbi:hypothetical protein BDV3_002134 [Batrachochytrium dendrobatidis]
MSDHSSISLPVFTKTAIRKKRPYRKKPDDTTDINGIQSTETKETKDSSDEDEHSRLTLQEALELRKLRKPKPGISAASLETGKVSLPNGKHEVSVETLQDQDDPWKLKNGGLINISDIRGRSFGEEGSGTGGFETASKAMDTEKHMKAFIEKELRKRRGDAPSTTSDTSLPSLRKLNDELKTGPTDYDEELYRIPDALTIPVKPIKEDNVTLSTGMLMSIPEVDLGVSNKLKNIEETEQAKRSLLEKGQSIKPGDAVFDTMQKTRFMSTERFWGSGAHSTRSHGGNNDRNNHQNHGQTDGNTTHADNTSNSGKLSRKMMATDMLVMEKFKKRMRR